MDHHRRSLRTAAPPPFVLDDVSALPPGRLSPTPFRPGVAVVVGVLTSVFSLTFLLLLYAKHCKRSEDAYESNGGAGGVSGYPHGVAERRRSGVDRAVVESLPVFRFAALRGEKEGLECAVCLGRFEPAEALRLLPKCRHGFHVECVDTWLDAHSTCPLCRSRVDPEDILLLPELRQEQTKKDAQQSELKAVTKESTDKLDHVDPLSTTTMPPGGRRISGRHSTGSFHLPTQLRPGRRRSVDYAAVRARKDRALMTPETPAEREAFERRFSHQIVVADDEAACIEAQPRRNELLFLQSGMIANSGRVSVSRAAALARFSCSAALASSNNSSSLAGRCNSEIAGVSRFPPTSLEPAEPSSPESPLASAQCP